MTYTPESLVHLCIFYDSRDLLLSEIRYQQICLLNSSDAGKFRYLKRMTPAK